MQQKEEKYIFGVVKVGDKGQIVIPKEARKVYDIKPGDALLLLGGELASLWTLQMAKTASPVITTDIRCTNSLI